MLAASMFHVCGLYVSCLRPLSTTHGYDKGRIAFWGARKRLGALAVLCGLRGGLANNGAGFVLWTRALGLVLFGRSFRDSCFGSFFSWFVLFGRSFRGSCFSVVLFVVRAFGRSFRGSCFWVRSFGRSFRGSCFGFVFLARSSGSCFWGLVCVFCSML